MIDRESCHNKLRYTCLSQIYNKTRSDNYQYCLPVNNLSYNVMLGLSMFTWAENLNYMAQQLV